MSSFFSDAAFAPNKWQTSRTKKRKAVSESPPSEPVEADTKEDVPLPSSDTRMWMGNIPNRHVSSTSSSACTHNMYDCTCRADRCPFPPQFYFADNSRCRYCSTRVSDWTTSQRVPHPEGGFEDFLVCSHECAKIPHGARAKLQTFRMDQQLHDKNRMQLLRRSVPVMTRELASADESVCRLYFRRWLAERSDTHRPALIVVIESPFLDAMSLCSLSSTCVSLAVCAFNPALWKRVCSRPAVPGLTFRQLCDVSRSSVAAAC
jgi:hypothetical protein